MAPRHKVDPNKFMGVGALVDWAAVAKTQTGRQVTPPDEIARWRKLNGTGSVQLRWAFDAGLGYPRTPFTVWTRTPDGKFGEIGWSQVPGFTGTTLMLDSAYAEVVLEIGDGPGGVATAFNGMPFATMVSAMAPVAAGATAVRITAPEIRVVVVPAGTQVDLVRGRTSELADDPSWRPIEVVGIPGDGRTANNTDLTADQGMVVAPTDPVSASFDRFRRGAPFYGWFDEIAPAVPAPAWTLADPAAIIKLFQSQMLDDFIQMVDAGNSSQQATQQFTRTVATGSGRTADMQFNPLTMLLYGAATDPLDALVTGFGTAYSSGDLDLPMVMATHAVSVPRRWLDFMVTATFVDPVGKDVEWAALILGVGPTLPPPVPSNLSGVVVGSQAPVDLDGPFRPVVSLGWDAPTNLLPFHVGSLASNRRGITPAKDAVSLLRPRPNDVALQPIGGSVSTVTPQRRSTSDSDYEIDSGSSVNQLRYSVAAQSIFGLWSGWAEAPVDVQEPPAGRADLAGCRLDTVLSGGSWSGRLVFDVAWNWTSRSPLTIDVAGRRYPQTWPDDPPAISSPPSGNAFASTGAGSVVRLQLDPDGSITSVTAGTGLTASAQHLSLDGQQIVAIPLQDRGARRYRVTVDGLPLDFNAAGRWGVAIWAHGTETRWPNRVGPDNVQPVVVSAADPRPPVITAEHEDVVLASVRGPDGMHRADLTWTAIAGATSYRIFGCSEATFRAHFGLPEAAPSQTLRDRLLQLRTAYLADPDRRPFTRVGSEPVTGTKVPVTLPRGTKDIHLYVVLGVSAGEVESAWPTLADPLRHKRFVAFAAPQVVQPGAPQIEVDLDSSTATYQARVRIRTADGATVDRVDLHRVRVPEAAVGVDTMGPPIRVIAGSGGGYTVTATPAAVGGDLTTGGQAQTVGTIKGLDPVPGSWKPVFYRAVAWATDDPTRGQYGGRSQPSVARQVVVPPAVGPTLPGPTYTLPTAGSAHALVTTSTTAPVPTTPLGDHLLEAEVLAVAADGTTVHLPVRRPDGSDGDTARWSLVDLPESAPSTASGLYRDPTAAGTTPLHLLVRRADATVALKVRLRISDPVGRIEEKLLDIPPGAAGGVLPDIVFPTVTAATGGWILAFSTGVPNQNADGPYRLEVAFKPTGPRKTIRVALDFAKLPWVPKVGGLLDAPTNTKYVVPLMRSKRVLGVTQVGVGFRSAGSAEVSVVAPDGARATISREIGSTP